jgi:hypothetical protein
MKTRNLARPDAPADRGGVREADVALFLIDGARG